MVAGVEGGVDGWGVVGYWRGGVWENRLKRRYVREFEANDGEVEGDSKDLGGEGGTMTGRKEGGSVGENLWSECSKN